MRLQRFYASRFLSLRIQQLTFGLNEVAIMAFGAIKLSVVLLYRRIFVGSLFNRYSLIMCALIILWSASFLFTSAFACGTNIAYLWRGPATMKEYCLDVGAVNLGFGVSDVSIDIMILVTPIPIVWKLKMSMANKIGLMAVFLLGLL